MAKNERPHPVMPTPEHLQAFESPLELQCEACGGKGKYRVGRIFIDTSVVKPRDPSSYNRAFATTAYFRCKHCQAGGPGAHGNEPGHVDGPARRGAPRPGRRPDSPGQGDDVRWHDVALRDPGRVHLKQLIEKDPGNYFVWGRLGNLYKIAEVPDMALEAYHEALKRNEHDVESLHSIAEIYEERGEIEAAARYYHQFLLHARHAPVKTSRELLRGLVRHTLETLAKLHVKSGRRIPFLPEQPLPGVNSPAEATLILSQYNLSDERDVERMVDLWITGLPSASAAQARRGPAGISPRLSAPPAAPQRVGRNAPCPCGSGKKFKNCCLRS